MFTQHFDSYVVIGETITCDVDGFHCVAMLHHDEDTVAPDDLPADILDAWNKDQWHYFGIAVTVYKAGVQLTGDYEHALWGVEGNYLVGEPNPNRYFQGVANDLLPDAIKSARKKIRELCT